MVSQKNKTKTKTKSKAKPKSIPISKSKSTPITTTTTTSTFTSTSTTARTTTAASTSTHASTSASTSTLPKTTSTSTSTSASKATPVKDWEKDGVNGGPGSIHILVDWLSDETNYSRWAVGEQQGISKESLCSEIRQEMAKHGLPEHKSKDIRANIKDLQKKFREAKRFLNEPGQGIMGDPKYDGLTKRGGPVTTIKAKMKAKFPYYYDLEAVMSDRRSLMYALPLPSVEPPKPARALLPRKPAPISEKKEPVSKSTLMIPKKRGLKGLPLRRILPAIPISAATPAAPIIEPGHPNKIARTNAANDVTDMIKRTEEMQRAMALQIQQRIEADEAHRKEKIRAEEERAREKNRAEEARTRERAAFDEARKQEKNRTDRARREEQAKAEEARRQDKLRAEKTTRQAQLESEEERLAAEKKRLKIQETVYKEINAQMWKSLGLSDEEVLEKVNKMFE
ncbi:hypothetical protein J3Q64DRAFT_1706401 [Phycomyces blakesleeanus]|uniref:Homeodomain-like DNA binding domain-containing transcription factor n=1 Tax=Phycomyces blakesleeanus TaxID=4837 RepID=A0ABR3BBA0_PHYBL